MSDSASESAPNLVAMEDHAPPALWREHITERHDAAEADAEVDACRAAVASSIRAQQARAFVAADQERRNALAWVTDVHFKASGEALAKYLQTRLSQLLPDDPLHVTAVVISWDRKRQPPAGMASVQFSSAHELDLVLDVAPGAVFFWGRSLRIMRAWPGTRIQLRPPPQRYDDVQVDVGFLGSLTPQQPHLPDQEALAPAFQSFWSGFGELQFSIDGKPRLDLVVAQRSSRCLQNRGAAHAPFKVSIRLKHVCDVTLTADASGARVLLLRLRRAPYIYEQKADPLSPAADAARATASSSIAQSRQLLSASSSALANRRAKLRWAYHPDALDRARWERTTDPNGPDCSTGFGCQLAYRCLMPFRPDSHRDAQLRRSLRDHGVLPCTEQQALSKCESVVQRSSSDWSGGFDDVLHVLPFEDRYVIHALISDHRLQLHTADEAQQLVADLSKVLSRLSLRSQRFAQRCSMPVSTECIRRVVVTPLRVCPRPPETEAGNRMLQQHSAWADRFLRVTFADENFSSAHRLRHSDAIMSDRFLEVLKGGLVVAGRRYVLLGYSSSQLTERSAWFYAEGNAVPTAQQIRDSFGDVSNVLGVGSYAAGLGQGFIGATPALGAKERKCFLDRQIILVLIANGVEERCIRARFRAALQIARDGTTDNATCKQLFLSTLQALHPAVDMLQAGFEVQKDPFLRSVAVAASAQLIADLQLRAKLHVSKGATLTGVLDETDSLPAGTVYFQTMNSDGPPAQRPSGERVAVFSSLCMHPGDVQVFRVADAPALHHLTSILVFSALGPRSHLVDLAGRDLPSDSDLTEIRVRDFSVIWDSDLVPPSTCAAASPSKSAAAAEYSAQSSNSVRGCDVTPSMLAEWFIDHLRNDNLGYICNAHMALADKPTDANVPARGVTDDVCIELAALARTASAFATTGEPARINEALRSSLSKLTYPDFMNNRRGAAYQSGRLLGQMYREVKDFAATLPQRVPAFPRPSELDRRLLVNGHEAFRDESMRLAFDYNKRSGSFWTSTASKARAKQ